MSDLVYKNYLFSSREFMVLSAYAGMDRVNILFEREPGQVSRKELNLLLFQLYKRKILSWKEGDVYTMIPEVRNLFRVMKLSAREFQIYTKEKGSPLLCFWNGETMVVTELSKNERDTIKIHETSGKEFFLELYDRGILQAGCAQTCRPDTGQEVGEEFLNCCRGLVQNDGIRFQTVKKLLREKHEISAFITIYDRCKRKDLGIILLLDDPIRKRILYIGQETLREAPYTVNHLEKCMLQKGVEES